MEKSGIRYNFRLKQKCQRNLSEKANTCKMQLPCQSLLKSFVPEKCRTFSKLFARKVLKSSQKPNLRLSSKRCKFYRHLMEI